jgi:bifunctional non-homologous end joining protein LigD
MPIVEAVELFFQDGTSDKVYNVRLVVENGLWTVHCEWGRRGISNFQKGTRAIDTTEQKARRAFDSVIREKTNKGYQRVTATVQPAAVAPPAGQGSTAHMPKKAGIGVAAQLLNPIEDHELDAFLKDENVFAQQKIDGIRVLVHAGTKLVAGNRDGDLTDKMPQKLLDALIGLPIDTIVDGEVLGDTYWLFDVLRHAGQDTTQMRAEDRYKLLKQELGPQLMRYPTGGGARVLKSAFGFGKKRTLMSALVKAGAEGIVFKDRAAPYVAGRPSSGGTQRKHKLVKSCDVVVTANSGNAYAMAVHDPAKGALFSVGNVFAGTTNHSRAVLDALLKKGAQPVCEVRYLYATDDDQLFQPVFVRTRDDKLPDACGRDQLERTNKNVIE